MNIQIGDIVKIWLPPSFLYSDIYKYNNKTVTVLEKRLLEGRYIYRTDIKDYNDKSETWWYEMYLVKINNCRIDQQFMFDFMKG